MMSARLSSEINVPTVRHTNPPLFQQLTHLPMRIFKADLMVLFSLKAG